MPEPAAERARLFAAFTLPDDLVAGLEAWQTTELDPELWRAVAPESLHLTLVFLGSTPATRIDEISRIVDGALPERAPELALRSAPVEIPRRRPRTLALEADAPGVAAIASAIAAGLEAARLYEREARPYWPHLTVARIRKPQTAGRRSRPRESRAAKPLPSSLCEPVALHRIVLYRSETRPEGAKHTAEREFRLTD